MGIEYQIGDLDQTFDEKGNVFLAIRELQWGNKGDYKIDLRKWFMNSEGEETVGKGVSFLTEEGPHELVRIMTKEGFGHTEEILNEIKDRDDFNSSLTKVLGKEKVESLGIESVEEEQEYYDPISDIFDDTNKGEE